MYLEKAVALVLGFIGLKLGLQVAGVELSSAVSLGVVVSTLGGGVLLSQFADSDEKEAFLPAVPQSIALQFASFLAGLREAAKKLRTTARQAEDESEQ